MTDVELRIIDAINQGHFTIGDRQDGENTVVYIDRPYDEVFEDDTQKYMIAFDNTNDGVTSAIMTGKAFQDRFGCSIHSFNDVVNDSIDDVCQIEFTNLTSIDR